MNRIAIIGLFVATGLQLCAQSAEYEKAKKEKLAKPSPFEKIIADKDDRVLVFQDDLVVAFEPLRKQAPIHLLIVPKKRIPTLNDAGISDEIILGRMMSTAAMLAKKFGIDESGYRVSLNTNEDSGQSVFHIHLHLLGGKKLGPMVLQETN